MMRPSTRQTGLVYLTDPDLAGLRFPSGGVRHAVEHAIMSFKKGSLETVLKASLPTPLGSYFQALPGSTPDGQYACVKWVGVAARAYPGLPTINAMIILSDSETGQPRAIMDAGWITTTRTAAMSAIAAEKLMNPSASSFGFIGGGAQARSHLVAIRSLSPSFDRAYIYSEPSETARQFAKFAEKYDITPFVETDPEVVLKNADVIVSTVPQSAISAPFLDAGLLKPGAIALMVDLGRSWHKETLLAMDVIVTDDRDQSAVLARDGKLAHAGPFDYDLAELLDLTLCEPRSAKLRKMFVFGGMGICDAAVAGLCYDIAMEVNAGLSL